MSSLEDLSKFLAVKEVHYHECVDVVTQNFVLNNLKGNVRYHHMRFDGNGLPMVKALAEVLYDYIIDYCISARNRSAPLTTVQSARLVKEARALFRRPEVTAEDPDETGEAGEALLFFLTEAILKAPQIVAKMELKTNHRDEVKGSDGIHARWDPTSNIVDFYFGESKLYKDVNSAISAVIKSVNGFHDNEMYRHELVMVTKHFKYADEKVRERISDLIKRGEPGAGARLNHACLIGYDWAKYKSLDSADLKNDFLAHLVEDSQKIIKNLDKKFESFEKLHLRFEFFFIPFPSVAEFRNAFNAALK
ncbi:hypothetical protein CR105_25585 [Massilia eurypsychrophila]|uniref:Anti-bacteriophage protein A/HamA C-terminal domain-containing protein n=1 Tax=Massilia eurypsychrophila TaxID=1485217 RepID=A0A2G8T863_9BURK|nr:DUF1837 domain-containing protein [Massilia eurypsychrophila]PIL42179.1 hypothetical protein CR105_25585 [Massilia eurypsychrophila]